MAPPPRPASGLPVDTVLGLLAAASADHDADDDPARVLAGLGLADDEVHRLDEALRRLRGESLRWRRRGQELAALFSSARELVRVRDVDALLERLVERAHDLVGTDVAYLSEFDETTRELRVRTTRGTVSAGFPGLRVPPGKGLASSVAETRSPHWTSRYAAMTQAPHDETIDLVVGVEGLVSLLGVPLLAGEEVIGVLFAANRSEHTFTPEEVSLLSAFADHAALVLQTARLLARTRESADETERAYRRLADHVEAMERASEVHADLTALVLQGGDALDVAGALGRALQCEVTILDADLAGPESEHAPPAAVRAAVTESRRTGRCVPLPEDPGVVAVAVVAGDAFLGALLLREGAVGFGDVEHRTAERAAQITALLRLKQDAAEDAEHRVRADLLADLLADDEDRRAGAAGRARARGIDVDRWRSLVVVGVSGEHRRPVRRAAHRAAGPDGLVAEHGEHLVVLGAETDPARAARRLHDAVGDGVPTLAVGADLDLPSDPREPLAGASACLRILPALGLTDVAVAAEEYLPYTALFGPDEARVHAFVRRVLGPVLDWDDERGATLLPTLAAYLDHRQSPVATGRALHLHKNTVLQRLERVAALLGDDWQEPDRLFRLGVAVRIARLAAHTG
ncbi:helix-turn-helix domain-containing protein [Actinomycetospora straminea]|uniref:GAF domain-containing protein n=1 Tax=Actinomycetospora straminea TaxID=663607 RepID=A0ABP9EFF4_9PSEU|nr:helix-turn-helix domain-containing protein [Actinomycetospora straminea]MDD7935702.1 GAF domain-containing protein [Actinomycetospora straminea]